jgi:hypothetical protein
MIMLVTDSDVNLKKTLIIVEMMIDLRYVRNLESVVWEPKCTKLLFN